MSSRPILERIRALALPSEGFIVIGSGIMNALGLRESEDVDLVVSDALFDELRIRGWKQNKKHDESFLTYGDAEAWKTWTVHGNVLKLEQLLEHAVMIEDINFISLQLLRDWKLEQKRPKDVKDVALIDEYASNGK